MNVDADKMLTEVIKDGMREGIKDKLLRYNSTMDKLLESVIASHADEFRALLNGAIRSCISDETFCEQIRSSIRTTLAKTLVQRFGGELEKQVNALKSDPTTRARITLAIEDIVKERSKATV